MSELPGRPDIRQLRRQARELLRAAAGGDPHALSRLGAVSDRVTLSVAQLALAREHGFASWPALRAEVERRSSESRSFAGATPIEIAAGTLCPGELIISPGHAVLEASLTPSQELERPPKRPGEGRRPVPAEARQANSRAGGALARQLNGVLVLTDDRGARYALRVESMSGYYLPLPGRPREPVSLRLRLDPVPSRGSRWLELRSQAGPATRLLPSPRPAVRVRPPALPSASPAERELERLALWLIDLRLTSSGPAGEDEHIRRSCSAALDKAAQLRTSGELDPASELPDQLARLCAALTGRHPAGGLPSAWSGMLDAAQRADGPRYHLDIGAALPLIGNTAVHLDCLISEPGSWRVHLRARPGWWIHSEDQQRQWEALSVDAEDNLGGRYHSHSEGGSSRGDHTEFTLGFRPRLDPLASELKLTLTGTGEQATAEIDLTPAASPQPSRSQ
ncbi:MAG TPA: hypothetical protein VH307_21085 [Streptosporangiaceae bacterium]|jgi:hypothetical protein|nr:hypothetical protein [Streptosporangiaceae bacterium]